MSKRSISRLICIGLALSLIPAVLAAKEANIEDVVRTASKAIVNIRTEELSGSPAEVKKNSFFKRFFSPDEEGDSDESESIGSGVVLDPSGLIVTNEHLISNAATIMVKFSNRQEYEASVIAADPEFDIALLKVEGKKDFPFLKVRKTIVRVGERAIVIGNPYGLSSSVTVGVVSAVGRPLPVNENKSYTNLIQTDAAINPGNSGGALLDGEGNLIGIVTAIYQEGKGIGFAISIDDVMSMLSEFNEHAGRRPIIGIFVDKKKDEEGEYLYVSRVIEGSPAEKCGVRQGDKIIEIDGKRVRVGMKLQSMLRKAGMSGTNRLKVLRGDDEKTIDVEKSIDYIPEPLDENLCGIRLSDIKGYVKLKFKLKQTEGVVVTKVFKGGMGERFGLEPGDVIIKINNGDVTDKKDFMSLMVEGLRRNYVLYQVKRKESVFFVPIKLDTLL